MVSANARGVWFDFRAWGSGPKRAAMACASASEAPPPQNLPKPMKIHCFALWSISKTLQDALRRFQDAPRRRQDGPRRLKEPARRLQDGLRRPQDAPRRLQDAILVIFWFKNGAKLTRKSHPKRILC